MELRPDNRHLVGGIVAALLCSAYLLYAGIGQPGPTYYEPEFSAHTGGRYDEIFCKDCHKPWKPAADAECVACHDHRAISQALAIPAGDRVPGKVPASVLLHALTSDASCNDCHVEHRKSELTDLLKLPADQRHAQRNFFKLVHDPLPENLKGEHNCKQCHTPEELAPPGLALQAGTEAATPAETETATPAESETATPGVTAAASPPAPGEPGTN